MRIIRGGIFATIICEGLRVFKIVGISRWHKGLLRESVKGRRRDKFVNWGIVPKQTLQILWDLRFLPGSQRPREGMRLAKLLGLLLQGPHRDAENLARAEWIYKKIEDEIALIRGEPCYEIFIKDERGEFSAVSNLRRKVGTIFSGRSEDKQRERLKAPGREARLQSEG